MYPTVYHDPSKERRSLPKAGEEAVTIDPLQEPVYVTQRFALSQGEESGVVIGVRDYDRLIERLDGCKPGGLSDLWLAGVGAGVALAGAALVGALTLPPDLTATRDVLWTLTAFGVVVVLLCLAAYFAQRRDHAGEIAELKMDLEIRKPGSRTPG